MKKITIALMITLTVVSCKFEVTKDVQVQTRFESNETTSSANESSLAHIAYHDQDPEVRKQAVTGLENQSSLAHVAYHDTNAEVRKLATSKLTNQSSLAHVAYHDKDSEVRKVAISRLVK